MIETVIRSECDLSRGVRKTLMTELFGAGDALAHVVDVLVTRDGVPVDLTGKAVTGYFIRMRDRATVMVEGAVSGTGHAQVTLNPSCYAREGSFTLTVRVTGGEEKATVFFGYGDVTRTSTDMVVDTEHVVPSLEDVLSRIAEMEAVATSAGAAVQAATSAAQSALNAASAASQAAGNINGLTATAHSVTGNLNASATVTNTDGHYNIDFAVPAGILPTITFEAETGNPGESVTITSVTGTPEAPVIHLRVPRGATGAVENLTVNGVPVESGNIAISAESIGAVPLARTVNGKGLSSDVALTASDVGAEGAKKVFGSVAVEVSAWVSDTSYEGYPWRAALSLAGVTDAMIPQVLFGLSEAVSANFAPVSETFAGGVYVYAKEKPLAAITIPTILVWEGV